MTERERLTKLISEAQSYAPIYGGIANSKQVTDYLFENGVTLNRSWIPVDKALPTTDGRFEVTIKGSKGKRYVAFSNYNKNAAYNKWDCGKDVIAWRERDKPYMGNSEWEKIVEWCDIYPECPFYSEVVTEYCPMGHDSVEHYCKKSGESCQIIPRVHCKRCINESKYDMEGCCSD